MALIPDEDLLPWIDKRNAFRELSVVTAKLPKKHGLDGTMSTGAHDDSLLSLNNSSVDRLGTPPPKIEIQESEYASGS